MNQIWVITTSCHNCSAVVEAESEAEATMAALTELQGLWPEFTSDFILTTGTLITPQLVVDAFLEVAT